MQQLPAVAKQIPRPVPQSFTTAHSTVLSAERLEPWNTDKHKRMIERKTGKRGGNQAEPIYQTKTKNSSMSEFYLTLGPARTLLIA